MASRLRNRGAARFLTPSRDWHAARAGVIFVQTAALTLAFHSFCLFYVTADNTAWVKISLPVLMPLAALESVLPLLGNIGFILARRDANA